ncbi:MAG: AEC family transporter [Bacillota bacterium]
MSYSTAISEILVLFVVMLIGFIAKKRKVINEKIQDSISTLIMKIALPSLVLSSSNIERNADIISNILSLFVISLISYAVTIAIATAAAKLLKYPKRLSNVFISLIVFANVGFMGYPVARAVLGDIGVFYTSILNLVFSVFLWTYGVLLYSSEQKINFKNLVNIGTISSISAILLFIMNIRLPYVLQAPLEAMGKMTTPLSMLLIGALIANVSVKTIFTDCRIFIISFMRLILAPILTILLLKPFAVDGTVIALCAIIAAMPSGATNAIFAKEYDSEPNFASIGVFVTTLLSIITLPVIVFLLTDVFNIIAPL